jgi:hypothetical protein
MFYPLTEVADPPFREVGGPCTFATVARKREQKGVTAPTVTPR